MTRGALPKLIIVMALTVAALSLFTTSQPAAAEDDGPRMSLNASGDGVSCNRASEPSECTAPTGGQFSLVVEVAEAPATGYIAVQTWLDYGAALYDGENAEDNFGPGTCANGADDSNDGLIDARDDDCLDLSLTYNPRVPSDEVVWPDITIPQGALRQVPRGAAVVHAALTALTPPLPESDYEGAIVQLTFTCSSTAGSTDVQLIPIGVEDVGSDGTGFVDPAGAEVPSKAVSMTMKCARVPATPQPTPTPGVVLPPVGTGGFLEDPDLGPTTGTNGNGNGDAGITDGDNGGGSNAALWAVIGVLTAGAAAGLGFFGWRYARGRQLS